MNGDELEAPCRECGARTRRATLKGLSYPCSEGCPHEQVEIGRVRLASGTVQVKARCLRCRNMVGTPPSRDYALDSLPWFYDRTSEIPCERCGEASGVEVHHWAPQARFGTDSNTWPRGYLCVRCHNEWHQRMDVPASD